MMTAGGNKTMLRILTRFVMFAATTVSATAADDSGKLFTYPKLPVQLQQTREERRAGAVVRDVSFANLAGSRTAAYLVSPEKPRGKGPAVLFVHWYEPESKDSNRTQYLGQAEELARAGCTSLLIATPWSEPAWFPRRKREDDFVNSVHMVKELRRALDVLLAQPHVDRNRVAFVGHDFGMMYGATMAGVDSRVNVWALQAGTPQWANWFLYGPKMPEPQRTKFIAQLAPIDPVRHIGKARGPVLMQFATKDRHVPPEKAKEFFEAASQPKEILWYEAGHGLNDRAVADRMAWLKQQLKLR